MKKDVFQAREADNIGIRRYPSAVHKWKDTRVADAQGYLVLAGFLKANDVDGCVGRGTLRAIDAFGKKYGADFYAQDWTSAVLPDVPPSVRAEVVESHWIADVVHISQADPEWAESPGIGPDEKPCRQIGCATTCACLVGAFCTGALVDVKGFITWMNANGGYTPTNDIVWEKAGEPFGLEHLRLDGDDMLVRARGYIDEERPVIVRLKSRSHYVVAVGYERTERGGHFKVHDVGTWRGNAYNNDAPDRTTLPFDNCERFEVYV